MTRSSGDRQVWNDVRPRRATEQATIHGPGEHRRAQSSSRPNFLIKRYRVVRSKLASPAGRAVFLDMLGRHDPLIKDALVTILERGDFIQPSPDEPPVSRPGQGRQDPARAHFD